MVGSIPDAGFILVEVATSRLTLSNDFLWASDDDKAVTVAPRRVYELVEDWSLFLGLKTKTVKPWV